MTARFVVVEIARNGIETPTDAEWATPEEAEAERATIARVARSYWPGLGIRYEVRELAS